MKVFILVILLFSLAIGHTARAADNFCYCESDLNKLSSIDDPTNSNKMTAWCSTKPLPAAECNSETARKQFPQAQYLLCNSSLYKTEKDCQTERSNWIKRRDEALKGLNKEKTASGAIGSGLIYRAIPNCVFEDKLNLQGECGSVNVFVTLLINLANAIFAIIGAIALAAFIYGGFMFILSQGNPEKIKAGTDAMLAAFIGLAIAFGGYFLIRFLGEAIGLKAGLNLK